MSWWASLLTTFGLLLLVFGLSLAGAPLAGFLVVLLASLWAAFDSARIGLRMYKSALSTTPLALFFAFLLLGIWVLPWYLIVRGRILAGKVPLKDQHEPSAPQGTQDAV